MTEKVNALGEPAPNRTDFAAWDRTTLERFARDAADENLILKHLLEQAHESNKALLARWRAEVTKHV